MFDVLFSSFVGWADHGSEGKFAGILRMQIGEAVGSMGLVGIVI